MQQIDRSRKLIAVILKDIETLQQRIERYDVSEDSFKMIFRLREKRRLILS